MCKRFVNRKVLYRYRGLILLMLLVVVVVTILTNIVANLITCEYIGWGGRVENKWVGKRGT